MSKTFPDLASTENFRLWADAEDGLITLVLCDRGITVCLTEEELDELIGALTSAQAEFRKLLGGDNHNDQGGQS